MAHTVITDFCQDNHGNVWIGTQGGGLSQFNGLEFKNYTVRDGIPSNYIRKVVSGNNGTVWVATAEGIAVIKNGNLVELPQIYDNEELKGSINSIYADSKGNVWIASNIKGIIRINKDLSIDRYNATNGFVDDRVIDIDEDKYGNVWIGTVLNGLYVYSNNAFEQKLNVADIKGYVLSVDAFEDSLWVGTNNGTWIAGIQEDEISPVLEVESMKGVFVKAIISRGPEKWIIAANGLMKLENDSIEYFGEQYGFVDENVMSGFRDREGNLWFGTNGQGVFRYRDASFTKLEHSELQDVRAVTEDKKGNLWIASFGGGIFNYNGEDLYNIHATQNASNSYITACTTDKNGNLWFGTRSDGVMKYQKGKLYEFTTDNGLINNTIRSLHADQFGDVWALTINGISRFSQDSIFNYDLEDGLLNGVVWNIIDSDSSVLLVTRAGINQFKNGQLSAYDTNQLIFNKRVNFIAQASKDVFWVGYSGYGLCKYNRKTGYSKFITTEQGLISDLIHSIVVVDDEELLVATDRGVDELTLDKKGNIVSISHFGNSEKGVGLCNANPGAFYINGTKSWFGAKNGVFRFDQASERKSLIEPIVYIRDFELTFADDSIKHEYSKQFSQGEIEVPYNYNSVSISYFGTHIQDAQDVMYKYQLEGFQDDWSPITKSQNASFTNLPPNDYTFKVISKNNAGQWNREPAIFKFKVLPPFYLTSWFFALSFAILLFAARYSYVLTVRWRVRKALALEKIKDEEALRIRKMMARDFHDNMGNELASITVFTNLISMKLKDGTDEIKSLLNNIEKHSKSLYTGTKDFIWSMDPESDNLQEIYTYLKDFGEDLFEGTTIEFYSDADVLENEIVPVPSGWSRQIVLIFKEAMTNALKYSNASKVELAVNLNAEQFVVLLKDNGEGFDIEQARRGNGLRNMEQRARKIDCEYSISRLSSGGIEISLTGNRIIREPKKH